MVDSEREGQEIVAGWGDHLRNAARMAWILECRRGILLVNAWLLSWEGSRLPCSPDATRPRGTAPWRFSPTGPVGWLGISPSQPAVAVECRCVVVAFHGRTLRFRCWIS